MKRYLPLFLVVNDTDHDDAAAAAAAAADDDDDDDDEWLRSDELVC